MNFSRIFQSLIGTLHQIPSKMSYATAQPLFRSKTLTVCNIKKTVKEELSWEIERAITPIDYSDWKQHQF